MVLRYIYTKLILSIVLFGLFFTIGCDGRKEPAADNGRQTAGEADASETLAAVKEKINKITGKETLSLCTGCFLDSAVSTYAALLYDKTGRIPVCRVIVLGNDFKNSGEIFFTSEAIEADPKHTELSAVSIDGIKNQLVYFDSGIYYMGASGGEIFSYLVDASAKQVYKSHFMLSPSRNPGIFLSDNCPSAAAREFFISKLKKDYQNLEILKKDVSF